jgi:uncharacterized surface protein with fasciclin (FAS1) repeats
MQKIITASNPALQKQFSSTELAAAPSVAAGTVLDVINNDANLSEFAALVKATGQENLFSRADGTWTYVLPTNDAFKVLDQAQLGRLKEPRFKDQASLVVRQHVLTGKVTFADLTRRLQTGAPTAPPSTVQVCNVVGGSIVNGVQTGGTTVCTNVTPATTVPAPRVDSVTTESGRVIAVQAVTVRTQTSESRVRVTIGSALLEIADFPAKNGTVHTTETLMIPTQLGSLTDIVGRR